MSPESKRDSNPITNYRPDRDLVFTLSPQSLPSPPPSKTATRNANEQKEKPINTSGAKKWGKEVSRKEVIVVVALTVMILVAAVVAFLILVDKDNEESNSVFASSKDKYDFIRESLENSTLTTEMALPESVDEVNDADAFALAAKWIVEDSVVTSEHAVLVRYALASLYYANGGSDWLRSTNWMSSEDVCEWEGVGCSVSVDAKVQELDLSDNNLTGTLSPALTLLQDLKILWLDKNELSGPIRADLFASLPNLSILYLQENQLTGPIAQDFLATGNLCKYCWSES
jgi:Leucine-rich repeat (LRR) protein